jgi:hypothetical protein
MSSIQPAGISSYLNWKEKQLYLQTEFALRPQPRITTTVSCQGEVIYKTEELWKGGLKRQEDKEEIEELIGLQHRKTRELVKNKAEEILTSLLPKPLPKFWEGLSKMEGVQNVFAFDQQGKLLYQEKEDELSKKIRQGIISVIQLSNFLTQVSRLEKLNRTHIQTPDFKVILFQRRDNYFAVQPKKDRSLEEVISKVEEFLS